LERCRVLAARREAADASLSQRLESKPRSREETRFLAHEATTRKRAEASERRALLGRLNALLFGGDARFSDRAAEREDSFLDVLTGLLGEGDTCTLDVIEAAVIFTIFGIPFDATAVEHARSDRQFGLIDRQIRQQLGTGASLAGVFTQMRPHATRSDMAHLEAVLRQAVTTGNDPARSNPGTDRRLREFLEFMTYAAEPVRLQSYLHARVDEVEGELGVTLTDAADEALFHHVEKALHPSIDRMRRLREMTPEHIVAAVEPILDQWFRSTALPAVRRSLSTPFAAYWFYVKSGGVAAPGPVFPGSSVQAAHPAFVLTELAVLPLSDALVRLRDSRVPQAFLDQHAALEASFTDLTLSGADVRARMERLDLPAKVATTLHTSFGLDDDQSRASSLDIYARIIRDASRISGRLDRRAVGAAIALIGAAKSERLDAEIARILDGDTSPDLRLATYLETTAALMLELEERQARESAFRQGTAGAAVGWILSRFFLGGGVPIALWAPQGVLGTAFAALIDHVTPKNRTSGNDYHGKPADDISLVHDGREYHETLIEIIDSARHFLNISSFDWKTDNGGRDIAYRLMAKKLGVSGPAYTQFLHTFERGLPMDSSQPSVVAFYDISTTRMKDLLVTHFIVTSTHPDVSAAREALRAVGATLTCDTVMTCGDLTALQRLTGARYDVRQRSADYDRAWQAYQRLEALFAEREPALNEIRPRRALRDYCEDADALRRFVRRVGLRRTDRPAESLPISIVADAKQNVFNLRVGERSQQFPYVVTEPIRDIYFMLLEFDIRVVLWKGALEFPWRIGPVPVPGRKIFGILPMPFIPYPWLNALPGFGWAGACASLGLQYLLATDIRIWWASVNHTKSWSTEDMALESGMGMASKYYNLYDEHRTWHDMGVLVRGAPVDDVNDHFVQVFNEARVNNAGLPAARGVAIPRLQYENFRTIARTDAGANAPRTWLLTTHPEQGDANYRGVLVAALAAARHNIYIENSFFSDPLIARMLIHKAREFRGRVSCAGLSSHDCAARLREAVPIYLVLPDTSDKPVVDAVGAADFHQMLHLGIKVHRWRPEAGWSASKMLHSKVWLIDHQPGRGGLTYVGAANATQRSHLADNEAGILSTDPQFADQVYTRIFERDITVDSRVESGERFHVVRSSRALVRASRWLRSVLVELLWFV
jgi:phosphatidylserine/phosphatidylglycerophosphate/cardiolipin synthase-like enzyme